MPPPNNPKVARVNLVGHRDQREWVNTFHVEKPAGNLVSADLPAIAALFNNWWQTYYRQALPQTITLDQIQVRKLDPADPLAYDDTSGLPTSGGLDPVPGGGVDPANVSLAMSWRTGLAGRKFRGRDYIPGINQGDRTDQDRINSIHVTRIISVMQALLGAFVGSAFNNVIFHRGDNTATAIISWVVDSILDSQRRRLPARGR